MSIQLNIQSYAGLQHSKSGGAGTANFNGLPPDGALTTNSSGFVWASGVNQGLIDLDALGITEPMNVVDVQLFMAGTSTWTLTLVNGNSTSTLASGTTETTYQKINVGLIGSGYKIKLVTTGVGTTFVRMNVTLCTTTAAGLASIIQASTYIQSPSVFGLPGAPLTLNGQVVDATTAVAVAIDNTATLTAAGAKALSIRTGGTEKAYFDKDGSLSAGPSGTGSITALSAVNAINVVGHASTWLRLYGQMPDGASAVGVVISTLNAAYVTTGAKLLSIQNNGTEKAHFNKDGALTVTGVAVDATALLIPTRSAINLGDGSTIKLDASGNMRFGTGAAYQFTGGGIQVVNISSISPATLSLYGTPVDGASAVGVSVGPFTGLANTGAKPISFINGAGVEKACMRIDGSLETTTVGAGFILKSPDGTRYRITVANGGALSTVLAT